MPEAVYSNAETLLVAGDSLILYTDGITEAANPEQDEFGRERLVEVCGEHCSKPLKEPARSIEMAVDSFVDGVPYRDARTLVVLRRN